MVERKRNLHLAESGRNHLVCSGWDSRCSWSDMATAFVATQARRKFHLRCLAALTVPRSTLISERGFAQARFQRKSFISSDHLPPTSPAIPHATILPGVPGGSSLILRTSSNAMPDPRSHARPTPMWRRGPVGCPEETPSSHDWKSLSVRGGLREVQVHVTQENFRGPCSTLSTDLSDRVLHCKSPAAQDPDCRTRCSVATRVK